MYAFDLIELNGDDLRRDPLQPEGIVSKRKDSAYRSGRSPDWLKMKNPEASAVKREAEEDWGKGR
jgi:ATP-dependent DNA ligase